MQIAEIMTPRPAYLPSTASCVRAAALMRDRGTGDVLVADGSDLRGIVTDRDLVLRCMATGKDATNTPIGELCTEQVVTVGAEQPVSEAIRLMAEHDIRRLPVTEEGNVVGVVSLGDLAARRDPDSLLGQISRAPASSAPASA